MLEPASVQVTREAARSVLSLPFAIARITPDSVRPALRRSGLGDLLFGVPGVQVQPRNNPTQDPRIAVRGFGARSAFGVRGVKLLRDGVPLSLPDGQTPVDWLDLESIADVEVLRGTASALYGNASGGVIDLRSRPADTAPVATDLRLWRGGGASRARWLASGTVPMTATVQHASSRPRLHDVSWLANVTHTETDGPRVYARQRATNAFVQGQAAVGATRVRADVTWFDMPLAQNPGALTSAELTRDVRLADSLSVVRGAAKTVQHGQLSVLVERGNDEQGVAAAAWGGVRALDNPLPFAVVTVDRRNAGAWVRASTVGRIGAFTSRSSAGIDLQTVRDERRNLENCVGAATSARCPTGGSDRGVLRLDQREVVQSEGAFVRYELGIPQQLDVSAALRWDQIRFRVTDRFVTGTDRDDSGEQGQTALTPMLGVSWRVRPALAVYATVNTAFETPTVTELTTQADGSAGLNATLSPQRTRTVDVGVRGLVGTRTWMDLALFDAASRDELIPFDVPNAPGRRAFRNAGRTARRGVELSVQHRWSRMDIGAAYTGSRFRFVSYMAGAQRYDGNTVPGTPAHQLQGWATFRAGTWMLTADVAAASRTMVDDANTTRADAWQAVGVRAASRGIPVRGIAGRGGWYAAPMIGIDNLFDARYASAVLVNATRGRYYEPAPPRTVYAGVRIGAALP